MTNSVNSYFAVLAAACAALSTHSDRFVSRTFNRYATSFFLLGLKAKGQASSALSLDASCLPTRNEVLRVQADLVGTSPPISKSAAVMAEDFLDVMIKRRQVPSPLELELMARALYSDAVLDLRTNNRQTEFVGVSAETTFKLDSRTPNSDGVFEDVYRWDYWNVREPVSSTFEASFLVGTVGNPRADQPLRAAISKIAANASFREIKLLPTAVEIDDCSQDARLKILKRLLLQRLYSPFFSETDDEITLALGSIAEPLNAWAMEFEVQVLKSVGTMPKVTSGFLSNTTTVMEQFFIDERDPASVDAGCSYVERHILVPHAAYAVLASLPAMQGRSIHVVANGTLSENI